MSMKSGNWKEIRGQILKDPQVAAEYEAQRAHYEMISQIIEERTAQGLTQTDLAKMIGTAQANISRFESGDYNATVRFLESIAKCLGMEVCVRKKSDNVQQPMKFIHQ